ncbi:ABC-F family ATP-binding cassette domain-containing protein [Cytophagales bacterium LB-30]|uniref:ABC-F family ATP-binding cassette domain-containing protein n=1 Tax=Shiella aurantiaca TaxID=3058365 RepID=A0ABT8F0C0_9BACT|nr:ABC-F family ATP-binding cassette domain-containing protein [Shiella aurantiaca]MDN4163888.1 ABC-F family ATP-binding cassette domain-containing protein [Shiella aurantiaca]
MNYLSAENISKAFSERWLFKNISFGISQGEKVALVGANGTGKSTLLKVLTGELESDTGEVSRKKDIKMGFLTQQPIVPDAMTIEQIIFDDENEIARVVRTYEDLLAGIGDANKMQSVLERMEELNAWDYESKVKQVIAKLGLHDLQKKFGEMSGGQRKRVFLAKLLLSEPDLIIMDEPTNHLDLEAIEWLEGYLNALSITLIMVTHDRYFLDNVANLIIELDRGKLYSYKGNYAYFLEKKTQREEILKSEVEKARNLMRKELEWMRRQPKARGTKAKYRIDAFHELKEKASTNLKKDTLELDIKETRQGGKVLEIHHINKKYNDQWVIKDFSYIFKKKDRIGVVGKNGVGKSTFLNIISGLDTADSGKSILGQTTNVGYFTQEAIQLNPDNRVIEEVKAIAEFITMADGTMISASKFLEQFLFPVEMQYSPVHKLSGGERKRLQMLKILIKNPNFLILDEPTNDLDIDTLNVLEDFLEKFGGCLVLVSHDRYFMDNLVDQLFVFEGDGHIRIFNGNYSDYREVVEMEEEMAAKAPAPKAVEPSAPASVENAAKRKLSFKEQKELEELPKELEKLEAEKTQITELLNQGQADHIQLAEWAKQIQSIDSQLDEKTLRLLELEELQG